MADEFKQNDKAQLRITVGDRTPDGKVDLTVEVFAKLPIIHAANAVPVRVATIGPFTPPIEQLEAFMGTVILGRVAPLLVNLLKIVS